MDLTLPILESDMTFFSWMSAVHMLNGFPNAAKLSEYLLSSKYAGTRIDFPSNLASFCKLTSNAIGDPFEIATNHTILPYFLIFRNGDTWQKSIELMSGPSVEHLRLMLGIQPAHAYQTTQLKYCPLCLDEDRQTLGYGYWHRIHQLPTSHFCLKHQAPLVIFKLREQGRYKNQLTLPNFQATVIDNINADHLILNEVSAISAKAIDQNLQYPLSQQQVHYTYHHGLKQQGLLTNRGRIKAQVFLDEFANHFSSIRNHQNYRDVLKTDNLGHFLKLLRKPRGFQHPVSHILMIHFLFGSWDLFYSAYKWSKQFELDLPGYEAPISNALDQDLQTIIEHYKHGKSLNELARNHDVDVGTLRRRIEKTGLLQLSHRPKTLIDTVVHNVLSELEKGTALKVISSETGLSKATIDRICCRHPEAHRKWKAKKLELLKNEYRQKMKAFAKDYTPIYRSDFRKCIPSVTAWLTRNDSAWLNHFLASFTTAPITRTANFKKARINWRQRDEECLAALKQIELFDVEPWERKKTALFFRRLPTLSFKPVLAKLPKSRGWINEMLEVMNADQ